MVHKRILPKAVRIKVSAIFLERFFVEGIKFYEVIEGLPADYELKGIIQDYLDACYYFIFAAPDCPEGIMFETVDIAMKRLEVPE